MPVFFGHMKEEMPLTLREEAPMTKDDARRLNPLQLAYIGDTVYDLLTRSRLLYRGYNLHHCHQAAVTVVNAHAQAEALTRIEGALTEEEMLEHLNAPEVEEREDGTVTVYYLDQKLDVTNKFDEDGVCYVQLEGGEKTIYMTIKRGNGYATSTTKYILPSEFNN